MNKVEDKVFGMMEYVYSWESTEEISVFGKDYDIRVVAEAYSGQEILMSREMHIRNTKKISLSM